MVIEDHSSGVSIKKYRSAAKALVKRNGVSLHTALYRMAERFSADRTPSCAIARDERRPFGGTAPPGVVFCYADGRGGKHATEFSTGFSGTLQVDG